MDKAKMIGLAVALVVGGLAFPGSAVAGCSASSIGATTGNPERDTVGLACDPESTGAVSGTTTLGQGSLAQIGGATGNPEKDTFGYVQAPGAPAQ